MNKDQAKRLFVTECYGDTQNLRKAVKKDRLMVQEDWGIFTDRLCRNTMKSSEMKITVSRRPDGVPEFTFPKEWNFDKIIEQISELCCTLSEELAQEKRINWAYKYMLDMEDSIIAQTLWKKQ